MVFNSYIFVLFFLPVTLIGYFALNHFRKEKYAKIFLIGMSLWFYAYFHFSYLFIILASILFNYGCSKILENSSIKSSVRRTSLYVGILVNIGVIFYFKYFDFFLENIHWLLKEDYVTKNILMPLGISFFTFQQISYLVDAYHKETKKYSFVDYALFVSFFPQLVAGPIVLHDELIPQFNDPAKKKVNQEKLAWGIYLFAIGLFKKVMLADLLGKAVDFGFSNIVGLGAVDTIIVMLCYTLQIYFDFSGYSDMAIGIAGMFQIDLPLNFNSPYKAFSVTEFWKRWHMTLTRFLRKYVYFPLGGSRRGYVKTLVNIMIVYLISGIWHGAAWTFILWGLWHGLIRVFEKVFDSVLQKIPRFIRWIGTFLFINLSWVLFRASSLKDAISMYGNLTKSWTDGVQSVLMQQFDILEFTYIEEHIHFLLQLVNHAPWLNMALVIAGACTIALIPRNCHEKEFHPSLLNAFGSVVLLVWCVMSFSGLSTFLYFNF